MQFEIIGEITHIEIIAVGNKMILNVYVSGMETAVGEK